MVDFYSLKNEKENFYFTARHPRERRSRQVIASVFAEASQRKLHYSQYSRHQF
jgi:hypothetical protein